MYRRIVVALEGSEHDRALVRTTSELAAMSGASVVALHVGTPGREAIAAHVAREARDELSAAGVSAEMSAPTADHHHVAAVIANAAEAARADLVVMGSRGMGELHAILAGSVSRGVLTRTDRPVLLVRQGGTPVLPRVCRTVLVPVAAADEVEAVIQALAGLGAVEKVVVFHADLMIAGYGDGLAYVEADADGERVLREAVARLRQAGYPAVGRLARNVCGGAARAIAEEARICGASLIVAG